MGFLSLDVMSSLCVSTICAIIWELYASLSVSVDTFLASDWSNIADWALSLAPEEVKFKQRLMIPNNNTINPDFEISQGVYTSPSPS